MRDPSTRIHENSNENLAILLNEISVDLSMRHKNKLYSSNLNIGKSFSLF